MSKFFSVVGAVVVWLIMIVLTAFVQGVVLMNLWNWFVSPLGVAQINYWLAVGISMTMRVFINAGSSSKEDDSAWSNFFGSIIGYLIIWGIGAIIVLFI